MKKISLFRLLSVGVLSAVLFSAAFTSTRKVHAATAEEDHTFTAVVTSDLHYTKQTAADKTIVPAMSVVQELVETFANEVIDQKPDAWIITGYMTNSGSAEDMEALAQILRQVEEEGIEVISITGNHDYDKGEMEVFADTLLSIPNCLSKDSASLSYSVRCGNVRVLAMDDGAVANESGYYGTLAEFSAETMEWLSDQIAEAKEEDETVVFLSHRSVLFDTQYKAGVDYSIRNENLESMLRTNNIHLILSGHQHSQSIMEKDDLYEIISCMPITGQHRYGWLEVSGDHVSYEGRLIDFERYASPNDQAAIVAADALADSKTAATVDSILNSTEAQVTEDMRQLLLRYFEYYENGTIGEHATQLLSDENWADVQAAIADTNYGPWIKGILEEPPRDAFHLEFDY